MDAALIKTVLLAACVPGLTAFVLAWVLWRHTPARQGASWGASGWGERQRERVAAWGRFVLLAFFAGACVYSYREIYAAGFPRWPLSKATQALAYAPLVGAAFGTVVGLVSVARARWKQVLQHVVVAFASCAGVVIALVTVLRVQGGWDRWRMTLIWCCVIAIVMGLGLRVLWQRRGLARSLAGGVFIIVLSLALVLGYASLSLGLLAGCVAATVVGASLVAVRRPAWRVPGGAATVVIVMCAALLTQAIALGDGHERWKWVSAGLLAVAPWCAVLMDRVRWRSDPRRSVGVFLGLCVPSAAALALCAWQYFGTDQEW